MLNVLRLRRLAQIHRRDRHLAELRRHAGIMRGLRDNSNPFETPEAEFQGTYRLSREATRDLVNELQPFMPPTQRVTAIPNHLKVLAALHFFGHGSDQKGIAKDSDFKMCQASVSNCVSVVVNALNNPAILRRHVYFPRTAHERQELMRKNCRRSSIPGVIGYVDGAHFYIVAPSVHEEQYVNRHMTHSLNVQVTSDSDMIIIHILARHPGASHDSSIWSNSSLRDRMEQLYRGGEQCWLLGDSGYPHEPWLHVPFHDPPVGGREANFNRAHMIDRSVVERTIGHLRNRFRCVNKHRVLEYTPVKAGKLVNACAILHNKCVRANVPDVDFSDSDDSDDENENVQPVERGPVRDRLRNEAVAVRARIVQRVPQLPPRQPFNPRRRHRR